MSCISQIRYQFSVNRGSDTSRVRRLVRSKIEDVLSPIQSDEAKEEETSDIHVFTEIIKHGAASEIYEIQILWLGQKRKYTHQHFDQSKRAPHASPTQIADDTTDTEAEIKGKGMGLLNNMKGKAGRAGRRIGVNVTGRVVQLLCTLKY